MQKILTTIVLISLVGILVTPALVLAQAGPLKGCYISDPARVQGDSTLRCGATGERCEYEDKNKDCGMCCLLNTLYNATDWIFFALIAIAGILVILGAMNMIMSQGDPEKVNTGRNYVVYAAIGLAVGLLARAIPNIAMMIVG